MTGLCLKRPLGGLSLNQLKAAAVAAMVLDYIAYAFAHRMPHPVPHSGHRIGRRFSYG